MEALAILAISADVLAKALLLATVNSWLVDFMIAPVKKAKPEINYWWLPYVALVSGGLMAWFGDVNLLVGIVENQIFGTLITGVAIGGGAKQIHEWFDPSTTEGRII